VFIPVRLPQNAYDLTRSTREMAPALAKAPAPRDGLTGTTSAPFVMPALRDIGGELDRMLAGLAPSAQSSSLGTLGLGRINLDRSSTLSSTAAINTAVSSYQKVQLAFGSSTAVAQVSGTYKGTGSASGANALTVALDSSSIMGNSASAIAFHVSDQNGTTLFSYAGNATAGQTIKLGDDIGLALTFSQGSLVAGQTGRTGVSRIVPTTVDASARFDDADVNARPRFDGGATVGAGSFTINGKTITVAGDDSIKSVLQRITEQAPDIIASYENETIKLTTRDSTREAIVLADDTSGFLAATKLAGAQTKLGFIAPAQERLASSARFAAVTAGSFKIGDTSIAVDPQADTLATVLARMNDAGQGRDGLVAYYDDGRDAVVVRGGEDATTFGDDSSGFLSALGLSPGRTLSLAPRETILLDPGTAARLERATAGRQAELVEQTLAGPAFAGEAEDNDNGSSSGIGGTAAPGALGSARKAKAAYGREIADARDSKTVSDSLAGLWSQPRSPVASPALAAAPTYDDNHNLLAAS
jgi:hypothetical protein